MLRQIEADEAMARDLQAAGSSSGSFESSSDEPSPVKAAANVANVPD